MAGFVEKLRKKRKLEKLAKEMSYQPFSSPIPQGVVDYAREVGGRIANPANTLRSLIDRMKEQPVDEMAMDWANPAAGMAGVIASKSSGKLANLAKKTKFDKAHDLAQRNAALPIEQGGLGLPPNNTAMDRAKALGYTREGYHGTNADISKFDNKQSAQGIHWIAENPEMASEYARTNIEGGNVIPVLAKMDNPAGWNEYDNLGLYEFKPRGYDSAWLADSSGETAGFVLDPSQLRSRFAAFDPMKRNSANLLAGGIGGAIGLSTLADLLNQEQYQ